MPRPRRNICESNFEQLALSKGWKASKRGWPDFLCFGPEGEIIAVEVKPRNKRGLQLLKREQAAVMDFLSDSGIRCFVSDGETLEKYSRAKHAPEWRRRKRRLNAVA